MQVIFLRIIPPPPRLRAWRRCSLISTVDSSVLIMHYLLGSVYNVQQQGWMACTWIMELFKYLFHKIALPCRFILTFTHLWLLIITSICMNWFNVPWKLSFLWKCCLTFWTMKSFTFMNRIYVSSQVGALWCSIITFWTLNFSTPMNWFNVSLMIAKRRKCCLTFWTLQSFTLMSRMYVFF